MNKRIVLFIDKGCPHCEDVINKLNEKNIKFDKIDINESTYFWKVIVEYTEQDYVPTLLTFDYEDNWKIYTPIKDYSNTDELLSLIEKIIK
jgi:glutaredoxin